MTTKPGVGLGGTAALLDLYSVAGSRIQEGIIHSEEVTAAAWWDRYRMIKDRQFMASIGASLEKAPAPKPPEMPAPKLGVAAKTDLKPSDLWMQSSTQADYFFSQSSPMWDYIRETNQMNNKPFHKRGMPHYYGRSLHSSSSDGTDHSSRRG